MTIPCRSRWRSVRNTFLCPATDVCKPRLSVHSPARRTMRTMSSERPFHHLVRTGPLAVSPRHYLQSDDHSPPASNDEFSNSWESISSCSQKREFRFRLVFAVFLEFLGLLLNSKKYGLARGGLQRRSREAPRRVASPPRHDAPPWCFVVEVASSEGVRARGRRASQGGGGPRAARERMRRGSAEPRATLRGFAASLCPGRTCFAPFGAEEHAVVEPWGTESTEQGRTGEKQPLFFLLRYFRSIRFDVASRFQSEHEWNDETPAAFNSTPGKLGNRLSILCRCRDGDSR